MVFVGEDRLEDPSNDLLTAYLVLILGCVINASLITVDGTTQYVSKTI